MQKPRILGLAAALLLPSAANAASVTIPFRGEVMSTCVITVESPGTLAVSPDYTVLSSTLSGGVPGRASVLATGVGYSLSTTAPMAFTQAPPTGNSHTTFASSYSTTGATSVSAVPGTTSTPLASGHTVVSVDLTATKSASIFPVGTYIADVVVTCE